MVTRGRMNKKIDIQIATTHPIPVSKKHIQEWALIALGAEYRGYELTLRFVDVPEIQTLNRTYRQQDKATNVLAFPSAIPEEIRKVHPFLGDVIICPDVLQTESEDANVPLEEHWAHIIVHGILHLLGHDHIEAEETAVMQALEIELLSKLGFSNPYPTEDNHLEEKR